MFADAAARRPQHAQRVGLVDHQQRLVPLLDLDELRQIGNVAVHAVHALDDQQHAAILVPELLEQRSRRPANRCGRTAAAAPERMHPWTMLLWASAS